MDPNKRTSTPSAPNVPRQGQFLTVYDPRKRHQTRLRYQPVQLKPVEEVEGGCSSPSPPPPTGSTQVPSSSSTGLAGPSRGSLSRRLPKSTMVDSTGVNSAAAAGTAGDSSVDEAPASGASSRSVSQEERSALSSALPSLGTSREDEQHSGHNSDMSDRSSSATGNRKPPPLSRSKSQSQRQWARVRNVMTLYSRLRQIKRTKSNQRWMKLRTTVQLSGAIQTIQKKPPLKREDSFLKRFSTRQVPEQQETLDHGDDSEGGNGSGGGLMSTCAAKARRRKKIAQEKRSVVNPDENFYFYWLMLLTVCVLYNLWTLIVRQSFPELQTIIQPIWITCDAFTDIIFLLDILVQFRTGYLEQGLMVYNSKKLAKHYMNSRPFLLDVSSLFPLDLLQFNLGINPILRFPRFLKVYRIYDYYYMVESRTVYPNLWRVINLVHILLILAHWFGCFYFLLSEAEGFQGEWVYPYRPGDYATLARKYLGSLYWSTLTLTTIGDLPTPETNADGHGTVTGSSSARNPGGGPHNSPPAQPRRGLKSRLLQFNSNSGYIFTIVSYLIGVFIFATIVGQVGNVITNRNANRLEFERLLDGAKTYMRHHKVPGDMKRRVLRWYDYSWSRGRIQGGGDINTALGLLPDKLKTELALHVNLSVLKKVTIFQECQPEFLHDLVLKMKAYIFTPGDLICRKGEVAREMFIIADGILEVISETGRVLTTMKAGDFFGEIGILNLDGLNKRTADVRSVGYSELFSLSREDVLMAMKDYPEAQEILQSLGRKRLMEARNVNRGGKPSTTKRRVSGTEHAPGNAGDSSDSTGKRIVDKIRCDVKGLKNVLRKSRRSNSRSSKEDSMELQPLTSHSGENQHQSKPPRIKKLLLRSINVESSTSHDSTGSGSGKGHVLRRMGRVHSDEDQHESTTHAPPPVQNEVIGAGLPLLQRLLMLKAKEDREQREREEQVQQNRVTSPPTVSTTPATVTTTAVTTSAPKEVIGAGLPLMTRLRMLKQREDAETSKSKPVKPPSPKPISPPIKPPSPPVDRKMSSESLKTNTDTIQAVKTAPIIVSAILKKKPWPILISKKINTDSDDSNKNIVSSPIVKEGSSNISEVTDKPISPLSLTSSLTPPLKSPIIAITSPIIVTTPPLSSPSSTTSPIAISSPPITSPQNTSPTVTSPIIKSPIVTSPPIISPTVTSPVSSIGITSPPLTSPSSPSITSPPSSSSSSSIRSPKPNLLRIQQDSKFYQSVDDLSPEYSGLPFVKKLKILNERQKLIELEKCVNKTDSLSIRSSSLDSGNNYLLQSESLPISRSRSETCDIDFVQRYRNINNIITSDDNTTTTTIDDDNKEKINNFKEALKNLRPSSPESPGSNETLERRNLKSILKKLSSSTSEEKSGGESSPVQIAKSKIEFKKLLRAPTVEGYAARHSKFSKSVTFNRETLSPPADIIPSTLTNEIPRVNGTSSSGNIGMTTTTSNNDDNSRNKLNFILPNLLLPSHAQELRREQEFFTDMMTGMKSVLQNHLEEIQNKFQTRFQSLELEVRRRDEIISQLQSRIQELEGGAVNLPIDVSEDRRLIAGGGSEDGDISDQEETNSDQPFMRGDSVDTVVTPSGSPIPLDSSSDEECEMLRSRLEGQDSWEEDEEEFPSRKGILESSTSWEDHSEGESQELLDLPPTLSPQNLWHVSLDVPSSSSSSDSSSPLSSPPEHNEDWEVQMLAAELDRKEQREQLEGELAELTGKSKLSKSELDILDQVLLETERDKHKHKIKNLSFDDDHIPSTSTSLLTKKTKRKRTTSDSGRSVENLLIRGDNLRSSLLRNRLNSRRKTTGEEDSAAVRSGIVSWLHKKSNQQQQQQTQQQIGKQVLNARSLEEPATSVETPTSRSSSIGHLPPTRVGSIFTLSRLRLSTLSHSIRGFTRPQSTPAVSTADPEKAVATITQSCPPSSGQS